MRCASHICSYGLIALPDASRISQSFKATLQLPKANALPFVAVPLPAGSQCLNRSLHAWGQDRPWMTLLGAVELRRRKRRIPVRERLSPKGRPPSSSLSGIPSKRAVSSTLVGRGRAAYLTLFAFNERLTGSMPIPYSGTGSRPHD